MTKGAWVKIEWTDGVVDVGRLLAYETGIPAPFHARIQTCRGGQMAGMARRIEYLPPQPEAAE